MIRAVTQEKTAVFYPTLIHPGLLAGSTALLVYLLTLAPDLTWRSHGGDGGELIAASVTLGVPHPTGYPTYVLLGKLFSLLPIGTLAYRFNLFSAVAVAATVGLTAITLHTRFSRLTSLAASLTLAFAPLVWSQATITEVYGLNLLAVAAVVWAVVTKRPLSLTTLLFALALTTHATALLLLPLVGWAIWERLTAEQQQSPRSPAPLLTFLLGLTPLLALPWLARPASPIVWGQPNTLHGWWWLISGQLYRPNLFALPQPALAQRLAEWGLMLAGQFSWLGLPLIVWGMWTTDDGRRMTVVGRQWSVVGLTAVPLLLHPLTYATPDAHVLLLPALLLLTFPLAAGMEGISRHSTKAPRKYFFLAALRLCVPFLSLVSYLIQPPTDPLSLRPAATHIFAHAPAHAILLTPGDATLFTLWYFHHAEQQRPDLVLVDSNLFAFDWYRERLADQYPHLHQLTHDDLTAFQQANHPFCTATLHPAALACTNGTRTKDEGRKTKDETYKLPSIIRHPSSVIRRRSSVALQ